MQKYLIYDANGNFTSATIQDAPPTGVSFIEADDASYANWVNQQYVNGQIVPLPGPTTAQQLATAQTAKTLAMYAAYQTACYQNVSYTSQGGVAQTYQADETSQGYVTKMLDSYASAQATPSGFYWVAADNTRVPFTFADLQGLAAAMGAQGWTAFQHLQNLKSQIAAATTVDAVNAITW